MNRTLELSGDVCYTFITEINKPYLFPEKGGITAENNLVYKRMYRLLVKNSIDLRKIAHYTHMYQVGIKNYDMQ